jgi:AcrR family transcriptional regulator
MRQNQIDVSRPRGRPPIRSDEETRQLIIEAANQEFQENGYAATGINAVAQRAGISTKTLYRLIPTKADLFVNVVSTRIGKFMLEIDGEALGALDLGAALEHILLAYGMLTLGAETIAITRLVIAESDRFPEIADAFYEIAIMRTSRAMANWLRRQCESGLIKLDDPQAVAGMLRGMMAMEPQRAAMLKQRPAPSADDIAARAQTIAQIFLNGCRA